MKRLLLVHGLKRSGNHGIINWLQSHGDFVFFNNVIPIAKILSGEAPHPPPEPFEPWLKRQLAGIRRGRDGNTPQTSSVIASLEDHGLEVRPFLRAPIDVHHVLILRDPYNLFASRIRKASLIDHPAYPAQPGPAMDRLVNLWKEYAREFLGLTDRLENRVSIYFNAWFSHRTYRRQISRSLGLEFTDRGFSQVSKFGGGSSFDRISVDDNRKIDVLNRQRYLAADERKILDQVVADGELEELAREVAAQAVA